MKHVRGVADCSLIALSAAVCAWVPAAHAASDLAPAGKEELYLIMTPTLGNLPPGRCCPLPAVARKLRRSDRLKLKPTREIALAHLPVPATRIDLSGPADGLVAPLTRNAAGAATETVQLAQAPGQKLSALGDLAPAAGPRGGEGESALTGTAPPGGPRLKRNRAAATAVVAAENARAGNGDGKGKPDPQQGRGLFGLKLWGIPPIRWSADTALDLRAQYLQGQPRRLSTYESSGVRASSYVWQPWFAQVNGGLRLMKSQDGLGEKGGDVGMGSTKSVALSGNGTLTLFPVSRFPFSASYDASDSRTNSELTNSNYNSQRFSLRQSYTPLEGTSNYSLSYDRSAIESSTFTKDIAQSLTLAGSQQRGAHSLSFNGNQYENASSAGSSSKLGRYVANHSYRPSSTLSVESFANYSVNDYQLNSNAAGSSENRSGFLQLNTFANWRPTATSPLSVTGGGRLFTTRTESNGAESNSQSLAAHAAASYQYNRNLMLNAGGNASLSESAGKRTQSTFLNGGGNYTSDVVTWGAYRYGWNGGANLSSYSQSAAGSDAAGAASNRNTFDTRIGHNLNRSFALGANSSIGLSAAQGYARVADSVYPTAQTLTHNGGLNWSRRVGEAASAMLSLTASDTRIRGLLDQQFQMVNLQVGGQLRTSQHGYLSTNLTVQGTRQSSSSASTPGTGLAAPAGFNTNANGSISYQHARAFGIGGLRSSTLYNVNQYQYRTRLEGDINAPIERVNQSLEQRFDYSIGRIDMRLSLRIAEQEGKTNGLIFFRIARQFGAF